MAGTRITQFPLLPSGDLAAEDVLLIVDVSDTFYSPSGTNKQTTVGDLVSSSITDLGSTGFLQLDDTPGSFGSAGQAVVVASDGSSLVFSGLSAGGVGAASSFVELSDTPGSLGSAGQVVVVSGGGLVFSGGAPQLWVGCYLHGGSRGSAVSQIGLGS